MVPVRIAIPESALVRDTTPAPLFAIAAPIVLLLVAVPVGVAVGVDEAVGVGVDVPGGGVAVGVLVEEGGVVGVGAGVV